MVKCGPNMGGNDDGQTNPKRILKVQERVHVGDGSPKGPKVVFVLSVLDHSFNKVSPDCVNSSSRSTDCRDDLWLCETSKTGNLSG